MLALMLLCLALAACADEAAREEQTRAALIAQDPVMARALADPLMSDPDLASRNEANAALGFPDSHALPVIAAGAPDAGAARDRMRLELLADGPIPNLPRAVTQGAGVKPLGPMASPEALLAAVGAPATCASGLREDFALAATLPPLAALPPQAMVVQAGGVERPGCALRIIRYRTAAGPEDVLQYHYAKARRAGLKAVRHAVPEDSLHAEAKAGERLTVHARPGAHGLTSVDLVYSAPRRPTVRSGSRP
ncbi:hypothetical protein [Porphyrobacter sp. YT40]|uniref:hypothetical protein n=1 Tax=Porphyrobacter sp. YT40 TaxID=2547601 RepID=UPI0011442D9C|nr:hypothetical protein [Porphyrobacter sp. YT40]QDH35397.1 hypothetical protein E2E27_14390 [Porphyrobacter sp. YT40]